MRRRALGLIAFGLAMGSVGLAQAGETWASQLPDPEPKFRVTSSEMNYWIGRPVYSDDHKKVGESTDLRRDPDSAVTELFYRSGGFLGFRSKHYEVTAGQIQQVQGDRVVLALNKNEAKGLPETQDQR